MRSFCVVLLTLLFLPTLYATDASEYLAIRAARPDGRSIAVKDLTLTRDVYKFQFRNGTFHFLAPLGERTFGAVFLGEGSYELRPSAEVERRHLALVTGQKDLEVLSDTFDRIVLFFSEGTAGEIENGGTLTRGSPDARATQVYDEHLTEQRRKYRINLHLRILQDLLSSPGSAKGVFLAPVHGKKYARALLVVDPLGIGALTARFADLSGEEVAFLSFDDQNGGFWYLNAAGSSGKTARGSAPRMLVDASHYAIDTTIESNLEIKGSTTIQFKANMAGIRVLPLHILPKLRLRRATYTGGGGQAIELSIVQEEVELGKLARLFREEVADSDAAVILPSPLDPASPAELRLEYDGREVLQGFGAESFSVRARESWYPNFGTFSDTATYELTYRFSKRNDLISTGALVRDGEEGNRRVSVWKSEQPMRVAGFNYGRFEKTSRRDEPSSTDIDVYTARDRKKFAGDTLADAMNTARVGTAFFGKPPYSPVSVTQQIEWFFGQSWPSLIYLPTLALTSSTERVQMFGDAIPTAMFDLNEFAKMVGWHEFAHQWWGHAVGWQSYRDQWLSEGFSEFTAALVLQVTENTKKYDDYWERRRRDLVQKQRGNNAPYSDAGPISQGFRLSSRYSPGAAQAIVYSKGGYVLHMLRMLMRERRSTNFDERFIAMMKDFVASYSGKSPSTADFQKVVERHMNDVMNAAGDGRMDWFFNQWVYGTDIPRLKSTLTLKDAGGGKYHMSGAVSQESVPSDFRTVIPIYADFGNDVLAYIGTVKLVGTTSQPIAVDLPIPKPPKRIVINALHEVLARD